MGHTPGPWRISARQEDVERIDIEEVTDAEYTVASAWGGGHVMDAAMGANARLIAAAPAMYALLRIIADYRRAAWAEDAEAQRGAFALEARALLATLTTEKIKN